MDQSDRHEAPGNEWDSEQDQGLQCPHTARASKQQARRDRIARDIERAVASANEDASATTAVLLVNHGSHSPVWRSMLLDVQDAVADQLLALPDVAEVRTAFMEYTEPSIATQLRAFDQRGIERVIVVPLLLTISDHTYDDIPTICGLSSDPRTIDKLAEEKIEIYQPSAELEFVPLLDFSGLARKSLARRVRAILGRRRDGGGSRGNDGLVLVGYGSAEFEDDWDRFFMELRGYAEIELGLTPTAHAWCGHIAGYRRQPTADAIDRVLECADRALVVPMLVATDEMFQARIIGGGVARCKAPDRVLYRPDAILPEPEVGRWVLESVRRALATACQST
jgi:hypothetical protein